MLNQYYYFQDKSPEPFNPPDAPDDQPTDGESLPKTNGCGDPLREEPIDNIEVPLPPNSDSSISPN